MRRLLLAGLLVAAVAAPAGADEGRTVTRDGMTLSVSKAVGLEVDGETVRVRGKGYDRLKGIYVAFCVDNGPGRVPTPCGGGADTEGRSGGSVWISDLPPAYGTGLARPYGDGGSFDVEIVVRAQLDEETDCRQVRCAVVTRNDHTRSDDRSQDVVVPVSFGAVAAKPAAAPASPRTAAGPSAAPAAAPAASSEGPAPAADAALAPSAVAAASALPSPTASSAVPAPPVAVAAPPQARGAAGAVEPAVQPVSEAAEPVAAGSGGPWRTVLLAGGVVALLAAVLATRRRRARGA